MSVNVIQQNTQLLIDEENPHYSLPASLGMMKGDIIVFRGESDPVRLPVGTDGQILVADSTAELGVRWADR
ncbi:MAG: hypothetical protein IJI14_19535 [Anaerolineaceae bacterium]|nr:hypothetical protein [Anaerolineaceae bacterium]